MTYIKRDQLSRKYPAMGDMVDEIDRVYDLDKQIAELQAEREARADRIWTVMNKRRERAVLLSRRYTNQTYIITFPADFKIDYTVEQLIR